MSNNASRLDVVTDDALQDAFRRFQLGHVTSISPTPSGMGGQTLFVPPRPLLFLAGDTIR